MNSNNTKQPLLSIICAVYNAEPYLHACIQSIINQTYNNWELILINDGSKDRSLSICEEYSNKDSRIRVYSQENKGQSAAQNWGLTFAKGEIIGFLDSDDTVEARTYEDAIHTLLQNPNTDIVQMPWNLLHYEQNDFSRGYKGKAILGMEAIFSAWLFEEKISWTNWSRLYRAELFNGISFKVGILFEDALMTATLLLRAKGICFSQLDGYNFFVRSAEKTKWSPRHSKDLINSYSSILTLLSNEPTLYEERCHFYRVLTNLCLKNHALRVILAPNAKYISLRDLTKSNKLSLISKLKIIILKTQLAFI